ncbi:double homeobox protein 4-like [Choloepus didactylus]|uniref:double homeobox protein 4-like n=1 Tax=Choloepus didactylus TaxID=27675 RepID=UPI00189D863D|nr:double homeobox protein 4-like [Choloepus didactylus]
MGGGGGDERAAAQAAPLSRTRAPPSRLPHPPRRRKSVPGPGPRAGGRLRPHLHAGLRPPRLGHPAAAMASRAHRATSFPAYFPGRGAGLPRRQRRRQPRGCLLQEVPVQGGGNAASSPPPEGEALARPACPAAPPRPSAQRRAATRKGMLGPRRRRRAAPSRRRPRPAQSPPLPFAAPLVPWKQIGRPARQRRARQWDPQRLGVRVPRAGPHLSRHCGSETGSRSFPAPARSLFWMG